MFDYSITKSKVNLGGKLVLRIRLNKHMELESDLKKFISALLPHAKGDPAHFSLVLAQVDRLIHIDEFEGEYYLIFTIADQLNRISMDTGIKPVFKRDTLISILEAQLFDVVSVDGHGFGNLMMLDGKKGDNLKDPDACRAAASKAMNRCVELYDEAFLLEISPDEAISYYVSLRTNYKMAVMVESLEVQSELAYNTFNLAESKWDPWRKFLAKKRFDGSDGWVEFTGFISSSLSHRIREAEMEYRALNSLEDASRLKEDVIERNSVIADYGIPPIDIRRPIMKTRYVVLIGKPGLGKTTISVNWLVNILIKGKKAAIFAEEVPESIMLYQYILPVYIYKKYGFFASFEQIIEQDEVGGINITEIEERKKMIKMAICDVAESGLLLYIPSLSAWNVYDDLAKVYSGFPFDYLIIDHSLSVQGGGETTPRLNALSSGIKAFKNHYKTSICLLSHPSPDAKKVASRVGASGLTRYSKQIEGDADDVFYLFDTPELEAKNLIGFIQTKGREASKALEIIYLTKVFEFKLFKYDAQNQAASGDVSRAIELIAEDSGDDSDGEYAGEYDF